MEAAEFVERILNRYATCNSYQDRGVMASVHRFEGGGGRPHRTSIVFRTAFDRAAQRFLFEFRDREIGPPEEWSRYLIVSTHGKVMSYWTVREETREPESLISALSAAAGVSRRTSCYVPFMLMRDVSGGRTFLRRGGRLDGRTRDGRAFDVYAHDESGHTWWCEGGNLVRLDIDDSAPERVEAEERGRQYGERAHGRSLPRQISGTEAVVFEPVFDARLDDAAFAFDAGEALDHSWVEGLRDPV